MILRGIRPHYLPPDATHFTFTGFIFDPDRDTLVSEFRSLDGPTSFAQQSSALHSEWPPSPSPWLSAAFEDIMFPTLTRTIQVKIEKNNCYYHCYNSLNHLSFFNLKIKFELCFISKAVSSNVDIKHFLK